MEAVVGWAAGELLGATVANAIMGEIAATTFLFGTQITGQMVASAAISMAVSSALGSMSAGADSQVNTPSFTAQASERMHIVRSNVTNRKIIYGRAMVSGPLVFAASTNGNNDMHLIVALAGHEVDAIEAVYLNDEITTLSKFSGLVTVKKHLGTADQTADTDLIAANVGWTSGHRLRGVAYIYIKLSYNRDVFARGIPNIKALVRGKKLYDPRTGQTVWSDSMSLAIRDYLANSYGLNSTAGEINDTAFIAEANLSEEQVTLTGQSFEFRGDANGIYEADGSSLPLPLRPGIKVTLSTTGTLPAGLSPGDYFVSFAADNKHKLATSFANAMAGTTVSITNSGTGTHTVTLASEPRYSCNGVVDTGTTPRSVMEGLLSAGMGVVTWPAGKWTLSLAKYSTPTLAITKDDFAGPVRVRAKIERKRLFNAVKGTFVDPQRYWQPGDFPAITNGTYATADGEVIFRDSSLPYTISASAAQRLAKIMLEKSRQGITVEFEAKLTALDLSVWDNLTITLDDLGWSSKVFKATSIGLRDDGSLSITAQEEASACYTWSAEETVIDPAPDTNLPDWYVVETPASLSLESGSDQLIVQSDGFVISRLKVSWPAPTDPSSTMIEIQAKTAASSVWQTVAFTAANAGSVWLTAVQDGATYDVRARYENRLGVRGSFITAAPHVIIGKTAPPSDFTGLAISIAGPTQGLLSFDPAVDADVVYGGQIVVRHSPLTTGAAWDSSFQIAAGPGASTSLIVPLIYGTYFAKWLDSAGRYSELADSVTTTIAGSVETNTVLIQTEHPTWAGFKNNAVVTSGKLTIDDDISGNVLYCGTYAVPTVDLGDVYWCDAAVDIPVSAYSTTDQIDTRSGEVNDWTSIDGAIRDKTAVELWVQTTNDDPGGSPTWSDWQPHPVRAPLYGRAFNFEIRMYSFAVDQNVFVEECTLSFDVSVRNESGSDVSYTSGTLAVSFARPYFTVPAISIAGQSMAVGDSFVLSSKSETGFSIRFRDSGNVDKATTFDWVSVGY